MSRNVAGKKRYAETTNPKSPKKAKVQTNGRVASIPTRNKQKFEEDQDDFDEEMQSLNEEADENTNDKVHPSRKTTVQQQHQGKDTVLNGKSYPI